MSRVATGLVELELLQKGIFLKLIRLREKVAKGTSKEFTMQEISKIIEMVR